MERASNSSGEYCPKYNSHDELEVAAILIELPTLIIQSDSSLRFPLSWGSKKRRSPDETSSLRRVLVPVPPVPSVVVSVSEREITTVKVKSTSPSTPLSFSPSECDEKSRPKKRKLSVKKKKEELQEDVDKLLQTNKSLKEEIYYWKRNCEILKSSNLRLLPREQQQALQEKPAQVVVEASSGNSVVGFEDHHQQHNQNLHLMIDKRPLIIGATGNENQSYQYPYGQMPSLFPPISHGLCMNMNMIVNNNQVGPTGIPDLNVAPVDSSRCIDVVRPVNDNIRTTNEAIAAAAEARRIRIRICREKNSNLSSSRR